MAIERVIALLGIAMATASCSALPGEYETYSYTQGKYTGEIVRDGTKICYYEAAPDGTWIGQRPKGTLEVETWASCPATMEIR
jgi:hypothetical protein